MAEFSPWVRWFEQNRLTHDRESFAFGDHCDLPATMRGPLIASLQRFQVGESGDGAQLLAKAVGEYHCAATFFVREEQRHAALLAQLLGYLDAGIIDGH
jgi:hypothetical protein